MKLKQSQFRNGRPLGSSRRSLIGVMAVVAILVGVITVLSMQERRDSVPTVGGASPDVKQAKRAGRVVTTDKNGAVVVVDQQTGDVRPLTPEEARRLATGLKQLVNNSDEGLVQIEQKDGTVSMDLEGRFQNVVLAKKEDDGSVSQTCVDNLEAASAFFAIDPKLLGLATTRVSPAAPLQIK